MTIQEWVDSYEYRSWEPVEAAASFYDKVTLTDETRGALQIAQTLVIAHHGFLGILAANDYTFD